MIEIYLHPEGQGLNIEDDDNKEVAVSSKKLYDAKEHLGTIEKLIGELKSLEASQKSSEEIAERIRRVTVFESYVSIASKEKTKTENSLVELNKILEKDNAYIPALLARSQLYLTTNNASKAKADLVQLSKSPVLAEYLNELERAWLIVADSQLKESKGKETKEAKDLCKKCLSINKSSAKAWFLLGQVLEIEKNHKEASGSYERAWSLTAKSDLAIGLKLATTYLAAKKIC